MNFAPLIDFIENEVCKKIGVPGCDLEIMQEHKTLLRHSFGFSDYDAKKPITDKNLYFMYSCTKPITCTTGLQLVEKGIINLDDPVSKFLPEFKNAFLIKNGKKVPPKNTMTIKHLFTMSAGFNYVRNTEPIRELIIKNPKASTLEVVNTFIASPLSFEPGKEFKYSLCHDILAAVIEVASGMKFSEYLKANIFEPLGMKHTGFNIPESEKHNLMAQYDCFEPGKIRPHPLSIGDFKFTENYESGGAGLYSCVNDYIRFADAMANGGVGITGKRILMNDTIELMRSEQLENFTVDSNFSCCAGPGYGYGLGVRTLIDKSDGQRSSVGEFGWDGAAGSYVLIDPAKKLSIFFAMHVRNWPDFIGTSHAKIRDLTYEILGL